MDFLFKHLNAMTEIPSSTFTLICVLTGVAMYFVRSHLVIPGMVAVLGPLVIIISTFANYGLTQLETFQLNRYDQWLICTITSVTIGITVALLLAAGLARLNEANQERRRREGEA